MQPTPDHHTPCNFTLETRGMVSEMKTEMSVSYERMQNQIDAIARMMRLITGVMIAQVVIQGPDALRKLIDMMERFAR